MSTSSRLISTSASLTCSPSSESRSVSDRMLLAICSSTLAPMARSFSRTKRRSDSKALSVCEALILPELAGDIVLRPSLARVGEDLRGLPDLDELADLRGRDGIERRGRLVHQQHLRLHRQGPGNAEALLLPTGERGPRVPE